jgi:hypothetical protein
VFYFEREGELLAKRQDNDVDSVASHSCTVGNSIEPFKVFFIGIHNKEGLKPLDSSTPSGQRIDAIIKNFPNVECIKVNLFEGTYIPLGIDAKKYAVEFSERVGIEKEDIAVCLGKEVCNYLANQLKCTVLKCPHPSPMTQIRKDDYIKDITNMLNNVQGVKCHQCGMPVINPIMGAQCMNDNCPTNTRNK